MLCAFYSSRIAVRTRPLLLRHAVPPARLLRQPVRTSAQLCQRLPPASLPNTYKVWCRAMRVNANATSYIIYILELPHILKVHPVFHVSKLKAYNDGRFHFPFRHEHIRNRQKPAFYQDGEPHYIAEAIVKHRRRGNTVEFLVKWQGFELHENEWGRAENLRHLDVFQEYIRSHPDLASRPCFRRPSG